MAVSRIQIEVDRNTYLNWVQAFGRLRLSSSVDLQLVGTIAGIPTPPPQVQFTGFELLEAIGLACTRPHVTDDPERLFALLKYCTKLARLASNFRLVSDVGQLDPHKKKVLSDEFGCGFAILTCGKWLGTRLYLDLHEAVTRGFVSTSASVSRQPDYLAMGVPGTSIVVLEAKGTQSHGYCRRAQIPSGCRQVQTVMITGAPNVARIVIGTEVQRVDQPWQTVIYAGDPPPNEKNFDQYEFRGKVEEMIAKAHLSKMASLVGDTELLRHVDPEARETWPEQSFVRKEFSGQSFVGSCLEVQHGLSVTGLFVGLNASFRENLLQLPPGIAALPPIPRSENQRAETGEILFAQHLGETGLGFYLWSSGPLSQRAFSEE